MWDLREVSLENIKQKDAIFISEVAAKSHFNREKGKTAIVTGSDVDFGVSRIIEAWSNHIPISLKVFRSIDETANWFQIEKERLRAFINLAAAEKDKNKTVK